MTAIKLFPALLLLFLTFLVSSRVESSVWSKSLDGIHGDFGQSASPTSDGGAIFSGITKSGYEGYLIKMNSTGNIQWQKVFGRPGVNNGVQLLDAIQTLDGGYIAVGVSDAGLALTADIIIIKTNSQGVVIWTHIYSISGDEFGYRVRETKDGGFMIAGYSFPVVERRRSVPFTARSSRNDHLAKDN